MDVVILAGGFGTRLQKKVPHVPKPLAPIHGIPFLDYLLHYLKEFDWIRRVVISVGYRKDQIIQCYRQHVAPFSISFSEENVPLGTGGALKQVLKSKVSNPFFVLNGDSYFAVPLQKMLYFHGKNQADVTMACREEMDTHRFGTILFNDTTQRVEQFCEKNGKHERGWINGGVYLMQHQVFEQISDTCFSLEYDLFPKLLKNLFFAYPAVGKFCDIGTEESYKQAHEVIEPCYVYA